MELRANIKHGNCEILNTNEVLIINYHKIEVKNPRMIQQNPFIFFNDTVYEYRYIIYLHHVYSSKVKGMHPP